MSDREKAIAQNLRDAGCDEGYITRFLRAMEEGTAEQREKLLAEQRSCILEKLHDEQKKLECLDYLRYRLKKEVQE